MFYSRLTQRCGFIQLHPEGLCFLSGAHGGPVVYLTHGAFTRRSLISMTHGGLMVLSDSWRSNGFHGLRSADETHKLDILNIRFFFMITCSLKLLGQKVENIIGRVIGRLFLSDSFFK
ncbi:hypothetical protein AVEN_238930-1 [Araneus ventricosus]|uniref:Uncharacterized protein n=1 Tax=Araneus ventricosus TaxID=182803 RepID=A0A4Y2GQC0_ARAVE|nr:hypothetical protein AVEN_238930-1 [Araneus ventricosus]